MDFHCQYDDVLYMYRGCLDAYIYIFTLQVEKVSYPGLKSFPQKDLAEKQHLNGINGSMCWFEVHGGTEVLIHFNVLLVIVSSS